MTTPTPPDCDCTFHPGNATREPRIRYCPLHEAAGEMRAQLTDLLHCAEVGEPFDFDKARALLARMGG